MEAEEIKKRWKEYIEELYKKELDIHDDVVSHPEPDILECEAKQALGSTAVNKASGWNAIPVELFITLKDDALKVLHSICQQICKTQPWPQNWKRSILSSHFPRRAVLKNVQTVRELHSSPMQMFKLDLEKAEEPEVKVPTYTGS